jgi:hypothetical protein
MEYSGGDCGNIGASSLAVFNQGFAPVAAPEAMAVITTRTVPVITLAAAYSMCFMSNLSARE